MYRVFDSKKKRWVNDNIYLTPEGELLQSTKSLFGNKLTFVSQDRYVYQKSIDLHDKNDKLVYVGDYIKAQVADDKVVTGIVTYANELSSYVIVCFDVDEYYTLGTEICEFIEVVGNVFDEFLDGNKKDKRNDKQSLQESEELSWKFY